MLIYLLRHGMTRLGEQKRYQGSTDTPLSTDGRRALRPAPFAAEQVFVSPLCRARETASLLFPQSAQCVVPALREMDFGEFEGRTWHEMEQDAAYRAWVDGGCLGCCPGGESREGFSRRVCDAFAALVAQAHAARKEQLILVAHGGTQMAVLERWGSPERMYYRWQTPCGSGWLLDDADWPQSLRAVKEVCFTE